MPGSDETVVSHIAKLRHKMRDYLQTPPSDYPPEITVVNAELLHLESDSPNNIIWRKLIANIPSYLTTIDFTSPDLFTSISGFQRYNINHAITLSVKLAVEKAKNRIPEIKYSAVLYNNYMMYYDIPDDVMQLLYHQHLIKPEVNDLSGFQTPSVSTPSGRESKMFLPTLHIYENGEIHEYKLMMYSV